MLKALYSFAMWVAQPLLLVKLWARGRSEPWYRTHVRERFGRYGHAASTPLTSGADGPLVWLHAVSLGEVRAAAPLVVALRGRVPGMRLLLTHGTATGRQEGAKLLQPGDVQAWLPWDTPAATARFLAHFRPAVGLLMETEVWPNLVDACRARRVPLLLANARLSDKSLRQALRLGQLARDAFGGLAGAMAQSHADAGRLRMLGAPVKGVFGNLKFDVTPDALQLARGRAWRAALSRPVVMLASSRDAEEAALLEFLRQYQAASSAESSSDATKNDLLSGFQWLIVPRHPQRFAEVANLIEGAGWACVRRSTWGDSGPEGPVEAPPGQQPVARPAIWLGDSLGEMALYYGLADVALLGGSYAPLGGQNLIEAAACSCPVIMGAHTFNFAEAAQQAVAAGAAIRARDLSDAMSLLEQALGDAGAAAAARSAALAFAQAHRGSAVRQAAVVADCLASIPQD